MAEISDDAELLRKAVSGDAGAFRHLSQRHAGRLIALARAVLKDDAEAEDVVQDVMLRLWRKAGDLLESERTASANGVSGWLTQVARNLAIDRYRKGRKLDVVEDVPDRPDENDSPLAGLETKEAKGLVDAAIAELPDRQRLALLMFHHQDMSVADIGRALGTSEHATESLLARARRSLKARLSEVLSPDPGGP